MERNYRKKSKFNPVFLSGPYEVIHVDRTAKKISSLISHPDNLKLFSGDICKPGVSSDDKSYHSVVRETLTFMKYDDTEASSGDIPNFAWEQNRDQLEAIAEPEAGDVARENALRRSMLKRAPNKRYINDEFINTRYRTKIMPGLHIKNHVL